jgi:hypothetical protein
VCNGDGSSCIPQECNDLTDMTFGDCDLMLGIGWVDNNCQEFFGCEIEGEEELFDELFFDSLEECEMACLTPIIIEGDINFDGSINVLDVVLMVSFVLGEPMAEYEYSASDINQDGIINVLDVVALISIILGS